MIFKKEEKGTLIFYPFHGIRINLFLKLSLNLYNQSDQ